MPLPLTVSCFSEILIGFTFLVPAHPGSPRKRAIKRVCVCVVNDNHRSLNKGVMEHGLVNQPIHSNSSMHHYECIALCKDISLQRGRFCARSLASCIPRSREDRSSWMFFVQVVPSGDQRSKLTEVGGTGGQSSRKYTWLRLTRSLYELLMLVFRSLTLALSKWRLPSERAVTATPISNLDSCLFHAANYSNIS